MKNKKKFNLEVSVHATKLLTKYEKFFSYIAGVVDTANKHSFAIISVNLKKN